MTSTPLEPDPFATTPTVAEASAVEAPSDPFADVEAMRESAQKPAVEPPSDPFADVEAMRESAQEQGDKDEAKRSFWRELPVLVLVALVVAVLIKSFLVQAFYIPSPSMMETLVEGDRVMVNKLSFRLGDVERGDVVVFDSPLNGERRTENIVKLVVRNVGESLGLSSPDTVWIKRVVGLPGETIQIRDDQVLIDGVALEEPYRNAGPPMSDFGPVTVPAGMVFVMGDNRHRSHDSRAVGAIAIDDIIGRAFARVWPPGRWGGL